MARERNRWRAGVVGSSVMAVLVAVVGSTPPAAAAAVPRAVTGVAVQEVVRTGGLVPATLAVAPDGRVFFGGPSSRAVHVWRPGQATPAVFADVPRGRRVLGLVLHPAFPRVPHLYATVVRSLTSGTRIQLVRLTADAATGTGFRVLRDLAPVGSDHSGGGITVSPDGRRLWVVLGDGGVAASAQDLGSVQGKVLRLTPSGAVAPGNPFGDSPVFAYGFRNSVGVAVDPSTGALWMTENGPECGDELNLVRGGRNYGWGPRATCATGTPRGTNQDGPSVDMPERWYPEPIAPTGAEFCVGCGVAAAEGRLVYGRYVGNQVRLVGLDSTRTRVLTDDVLVANDTPVIGVERAPDSSIWFSDTDSIHRIVPG